MPGRRQGGVQAGGEAVPTDGVFACAQNALQRGGGERHGARHIRPRLAKYRRIRHRKILCYLDLHYRHAALFRQNQSQKTHRRNARRRGRARPICRRHRQPSQLGKQRMGCHRQAVGIKAQRQTENRVYAMSVGRSRHRRSAAHHRLRRHTNQEQPLRCPSDNTQTINGIRL